MIIWMLEAFQDISYQASPSNSREGEKHTWLKSTAQSSYWIDSTAAFNSASLYLECPSSLASTAKSTACLSPSACKLRSMFILFRIDIPHLQQAQHTIQNPSKNCSSRNMQAAKWILLTRPTHLTLALSQVMRKLTSSPSQPSTTKTSSAIPSDVLNTWASCKQTTIT